MSRKVSRPRAVSGLLISGSKVEVEKQQRGRGEQKRQRQGVKSKKEFEEDRDQNQQRNRKQYSNYKLEQDELNSRQQNRSRQQGYDVNRPKKDGDRHKNFNSRYNRSGENQEGDDYFVKKPRNQTEGYSTQKYTKSTEGRTTNENRVASQKPKNPRRQNRDFNDSDQGDLYVKKSILKNASPKKVSYEDQQPPKKEIKQTKETKPEASETIPINKTKKSHKENSQPIPVNEKNLKDEVHKKKSPEKHQTEISEKKSSAKPVSESALKKEQTSSETQVKKNVPKGETAKVKQVSENQQNEKTEENQPAKTRQNPRTQNQQKNSNNNYAYNDYDAPGDIQDLYVKKSEVATKKSEVATKKAAPQKSTEHSQPVTQAKTSSAIRQPVPSKKEEPVVKGKYEARNPLNEDTDQSNVDEEILDDLLRTTSKKEQDKLDEKMKGKYEQATQKLERLKKQQNLNALKQHAQEASLQKELEKEQAKKSKTSQEVQKKDDSKTQTTQVQQAPIQTPVIQTQEVSPAQSQVQGVSQVPIQPQPQIMFQPVYMPQPQVTPVGNPPPGIGVNPAPQVQYIPMMNYGGVPQQGIMQPQYFMVSHSNPKLIFRCRKCHSKLSSEQTDNRFQPKFHS